MKNLRVTVDGRVFNVTVELLDEPAGTSLPKPVPAGSLPPAEPPRNAGPAPSASPAQPAAGESGAVLSPLAGKIVSIDVKVGQEVEEGAQLATIEAMKMNTYVFAPRAGRVTAIAATAGTAIEEGRPLLVIG